MRRGDIVESRHLVHAVAVRDGAVVAERGDAMLLTFMRSAAKPFQAIPLARAREDLDERDLAIASASHLAGGEQLEAVRALLAKAPATEDELECGLAGEPPSRLRHNCSGKHAGMLALARAHGWPSAGYRLAAHPVQQASLAELAAAADVPADELPTAVDGCGVVTVALPLERMAFAFSRLEQLDGGAAGRRRDARLPAPDPRPRRAGHGADARTAGLGGEDRRRGPAVRGRPRRARRRAQGRRRRESRGRAGARRLPRASSATRSSRSRSARSRTRAASRSARSSPSAEHPHRVCYGTVTNE